jgi:hypothetical protein
MRARFATVGLGILFFTRGALAQTDDPRAVEARKACAAGEVDKGVKLLADILATTEDTTAIYNMGRCYQQNGKPDKAALQFREYLRKATDLTPEVRGQVEAQLREAEADERIARSQASSLPGTTTPPGVVATPEHSPDWKAKQNLRLAGIGVGSAGVLSLGVGTFFGLRASSLQRQNSADGNKFNSSDDKAGSKAVTLQWVFLGVGAAAVAGGAILYYLGLDEDNKVALVPSLGPRGAGAMLSVRL